MEFFRKVLSEFEIKFSSDSESVQNIRLEMLRQGVNSQKDLTSTTRLGIVKPYFERAKIKNEGKPLPVGPDILLLFYFLEWYGPDVIASLIDKELVKPEFDYSDRANENKLSDHMRKMAKSNNWRE